jgi:hypothetical protein
MEEINLCMCRQAPNGQVLVEGRKWRLYDVNSPPSCFSDLTFHSRRSKVKRIVDMD